MKIAIVHEMLIKLGWAENVLQELLGLFPEAHVYTLIYDERKVGSVFPRASIHSVAPLTQRAYRLSGGRQQFCLPFMTRAVESFDLDEYDVVISSSSGFAHGCLTRPDTKHIVYYHSPARYAWDYFHAYKKEIVCQSGIKGLISRFLIFTGIWDRAMHSIRQWDVLASMRHDVTIANAREVQSRIAKYYRRDSILLYPPVRMDDMVVGTESLAKRSYYVITSAITAFKRLDLAVEAFKSLPYELVIVWSGDQLDALRSVAPKNVTFLWRRPRNEIVELYRNARGFIMCGKEDFGIAPIEAMAAGLPVFGLAEGGILETVVPGKSGWFFPESTPESFLQAFTEFNERIESNDFNPYAISQHAQTFSHERFLSDFSSIVNE